MKMWDDTNIGAQVKHLKDAGMSISAAYGGSGGSGTTTSAPAQGVSEGKAADAEALQAANTNKAMSLAQIENITAATEKVKAETENIKEAETPAKQWETELSKKLNTDVFIKDIQKQQDWATQRLENTARKQIS